LEELNLTGNLLRNEGVIQVLKGLQIAPSLKKIYLADNQFDDEEPVMDQFQRTMNRNTKLGKYDLKFNPIGDDGVERFIAILSTEATHVYELELNERVRKDLLETLKTQMKANKPKKGRKKGGKKKKK